LMGNHYKQANAHTKNNYQVIGVLIIKKSDADKVREACGY